MTASAARLIVLRNLLFNIQQVRRRPPGPLKLFSWPCRHAWLSALRALKTPARLSKPSGSMIGVTACDCALFPFQVTEVLCNRLACNRRGCDALNVQDFFQARQQWVGTFHEIVDAELPNSQPPCFRAGVMEATSVFFIPRHYRKTPLPSAAAISASASFCNRNFCATAFAAAFLTAST